MYRQLISTANGSLGEPFVYLLLHFAFEIIIQLPVLHRGSMKKPPHQTADHPALPLEQPANGTTRQMDHQVKPFLEGQGSMLPFLDEIGCMPAIVLYLLYHSHNPNVYNQAF